MPLVFRALASLNSPRTLVREEVTDTGFTAATYLVCGAIGMHSILINPALVFGQGHSGD